MKITEIKIRDEILDYYFSDLEYWEDFDLIVNIIESKLNFMLLEKLDGIAIRKRKYSDGNIEFIVMHDDHVGNYAFCENQANNYKLKQITLNILEYFKQ